MRVDQQYISVLADPVENQEVRTEAMNLATLAVVLKTVVVVELFLTANSLYISTLFLSANEQGSSLEFQLHQLQYVHVLQYAGRNAALQYARAQFKTFASRHMADIQRLMGCLLWAGRLEISPYEDLLAPFHWDTVALEFTRECCNLLGQAYESPLHVTVSAGSQALSSLLKLATVMAPKKQVRLQICHVLVHVLPLQSLCFSIPCDFHISVIYPKSSLLDSCVGCL